MTEEIGGNSLFALVGDVVGSRGLADRRAFAQVLRSAFDNLNERHGTGLLAPLRNTKGVDEFSGVIRDGSIIPALLAELAIRVYPTRIRVSIARGPLDLVSDDASLADGTAFHLAADRIKLLEKDKRLVSLYTGDALSDPVNSLLMHYALDRIASWPKATAAVASHVWFHPGDTGGEIAERFGISRQAVSKSLVRSDLDTIRASCACLSAWFESC